MCICQDGPKSCSALQKPGEQVEEFDVVLEVDTESLTEEAYRVGTFSGTVTLLVEAQVLPRLPRACFCAPVFRMLLLD